ncbi:MAG: hypothetical protein ACE5JP_08650 [Candidatus Bipolaricaulia bacterium]
MPVLGNVPEADLDLDLQRFVIDFLNWIGAEVEVSEYALVDVLIPEAYADHFDGREMLRLAFDSEVAREHKEAQFITVGSPLLERIARLALRHGRLLQRYLLVDYLGRPSNLLERVREVCSFYKCRYPVVTNRQQVHDHPYLLFEFLVTFESDEKTEFVQPVLVDLHYGRLEQELLPHLEHAMYAPNREDPLPVAEAVSAEEGYRLAIAHLGEILKPKLWEYERELQGYKAGELEKTHSYYNAVAEDLRERMERAEAGDDPRRRRRLEEKLEANEAERVRRLEDIEAKFSVHVAARLDRAVCYLIPRLTVALSVQQRSSRYRVPVIYNPLSRAILPPRCTRCGALPSSIDFDEARRPICAHRHR